jgi:hypothetical protein
MLRLNETPIFTFSLLIVSFTVFIAESMSVASLCFPQVAVVIVLFKFQTVLQSIHALMRFQVLTVTTT